MSVSAEKVLRQPMQRSSLDRPALVEGLIARLDEPDPALDALWLKEGEDPIAAYQVGELAAIDVEEAFAEPGRRVEGSPSLAGPPELEVAVRYYNLQRVHLGNEFRDEARQTIQRIKGFPLAWHPLGGTIRRSRCGVSRMDHLRAFGIGDSRHSCSVSPSRSGILAVEGVKLGSGARRSSPEEAGLRKPTPFFLNPDWEKTKNVRTTKLPRNEKGRGAGCCRIYNTISMFPQP